MTTAVRPPFRLLFLCTGNSARSQMAEAILNKKGQGLFHAASAGSKPADRVNPYAIETLRDAGIVWDGHPPQSIDGLEREHWDFVITVCDRAKESCPVFPGKRRIDLLLALPFDKLERLALEARVKSIGASSQ